MKQSEIIEKGEGDQWYARNKSKDRSDDPVIRAIMDGDISMSILEIGCSDGWRLQRLYDNYSRTTHYSGCDLSWEAINAGKRKHTKVNLRVASADSLGYAANSFDLVVLGFCMYLVDREDLFKVVAEVDRVLLNNGRLIIHDFHTEVPHSRAYSHDHRLHTYKMDYSKLFTGNPAYTVERSRIDGEGDNAVSVVTLRKNIENAWPLKV